MVRFEVPKCPQHTTVHDIADIAIQQSDVAICGPLMFSVTVRERSSVCIYIAARDSVHFGLLILSNSYSFTVNDTDL